MSIYQSLARSAAVVSFFDALSLVRENKIAVDSNRKEPLVCKLRRIQKMQAGYKFRLSAMLASDCRGGQVWAVSSAKK